MIKIGVLDLQGSVIEHINILNSIDEVVPVKVKYVEQLKEIDGLIIPGGESTTIGKLLRIFNLSSTLKERIEEGMPVWGTCAGMILLAKYIDGQEESHINVMDIKVKRNAYGSQLDSFVVYEEISEISDKTIPLVFIRAPYIKEVGEKVKVIKKVNGNIVAAREKNMFVTSFHPELTQNNLVHRYFVDNFFN